MRRRTVPLLFGAICLVACDGIDKIDYAQLPRRASWQHPEQVIRSLGVKPGDDVADIGAGEGYFLPYLADAVGPAGRIYLVDVEPEIFNELETAASESGYDNVRVILGEYDDPLLPDDTIDLALLVNTYHHIEDRPGYFASLRTDLKRDGRVAIIDPNAELTGVLRLLQHDGHMSAAAAVRREMRRGGYSPSASFDFLPTQIFEIFSADRER
jgi:ubiquinone/menaquinone biosynthesis C-methylase UbiE